MDISTDDKIRAARDYYDTHDASEEIAAAELTAHEPSESSALAGYSVRLPVEVLNQVRALAREQGVTTGAWLREAIENAVVARKTNADTVPVSALLGLVMQYAHDAPGPALEDPGTPLPTPAQRALDTTKSVLMTAPDGKLIAVPAKNALSGYARVARKAASTKVTKKK